MAEQWIRKRLQAELLSDAHLGSGSGGGGIDALVARDRHHRPVIWASHIEGVLRDAARRLHGESEAALLFGRAGGERQRAIFTSLYTTDDPASHIWRSTARTAFDNSAPKDDTLRVIEYVPRGTKLFGEVELPVGQVGAFVRLVQEVDALGSGRSTGAGRVRLSLSDVPDSTMDIGEPTGRLLLLLNSRDPVCITATATPDNLVPSLAYLPGRTLLGALAAWLIGEGQGDEARLLTGGKVSVSDALPLPREPARLNAAEVLPAPLTLQSEKAPGSAGELPWWAQPIVPTRRLDAWTQGDDKPKLKRPDDDLFLFRESANDEWTTYRPARRVRLRNGRPDPSQIDPSLFAIEQIVEGTLFLAELSGEAGDLKRIAEQLLPVLRGSRWLRVGRAGAPVEVTQIEWLEAATPVNTANSVLLTLTSDLMVRDEHLRWRTALDADSLEELLGAAIILEQSRQDSVMVHGFNGTSRLWRMPAAAIRRGSVFKISGVGAAKLAQRAASQHWLGERTHEGFGRFRIDAVLPGVAGRVGEPVTLTSPPDISEETIAAKTGKWLQDHKTLASLGRGSAPKPSLSQWLDLVGDLEGCCPTAISSRLEPTTAGGNSWRQEDARAILKKLNDGAILPQQRSLYARYFVRWLRADLRSKLKET